MCGPYWIRVRSIIGPYSVRDRFMYGPYLTRVRPVFHSCSVCVWSVFGSCSARVRPMFGPCSVRVGPYLVRFRYPLTQSTLCSDDLALKWFCNLPRVRYQCAVGLLFFFFRGVVDRRRTGGGGCAVFVCRATVCQVYNYRFVFYVPRTS